MDKVHRFKIKTPFWTNKLVRVNQRNSYLPPSTALPKEIIVVPIVEFLSLTTVIISSSCCSQRCGHATRIRRISGNKQHALTFRLAFTYPFVINVIFFILHIHTYVIEQGHWIHIPVLSSSYIRKIRKTHDIFYFQEGGDRVNSTLCGICKPRMLARKLFSFSPCIQFGILARTYSMTTTSSPSLQRNSEFMSWTGDSICSHTHRSRNNNDLLSVAFLASIPWTHSWNVH